MTTFNWFDNLFDLTTNDNDSAGYYKTLHLTHQLYISVNPNKEYFNNV